MTTIINFSSRNNGNCQHIADVCQTIFESHSINRIDFKDISISACGKCDYECLKPEGQCICVDDCNQLYESIAASDLAVYIIPNYCGFPNSNYFVFSERASGFFRLNKENRNRYLNAKKKFIVVTNSNHDNFKETLKLQTVSGEADILFIESRLFHKNPAAGDLMENEAAKKLVLDFLA